MLPSPFTASFPLDRQLTADLILGVVGWLIVIGLAIYFFKIKDYRK